MRKGRTKPIATQVSTTWGDKRITGDFTISLPVSLDDAILIYGEKQVFAGFVANLVSKLSTAERSNLRFRQRMFEDEGLGEAQKARKVVDVFDEDKH